MVYCVHGQNAVRHQYWFDGALNADTAMRDGLWHGKGTFWYKTGKKKSEGEYLNGRKHGIWLHWNEDGSQKKVQRYHHGSLLKTE